LNLSEEREKFLAHPQQNPQITYPELPISALEQQLKKLLTFQVSGKPSDLTSWIFSRRKQELELTTLMLLNRGNEDFGMNSCHLFQCRFRNDAIQQAKIDAASPLPFESKENKSSQEIIDGISAYLKNYGVHDWTVQLSDQTDFYFRVKAPKKLILIGKLFNWDFTDFDCMLAHEIDGHVLRAINAAALKNPLLKKPLPFYIKTEEGLGSFLGDYCSTTSEINRKHHALKYLAGHLARTASFVEVFEFLVGHGFTVDLAFQRTFRLKRGFSDTGIHGCFGKEAMYYEGMFEVKHFLDNGGDVEKLYCAKVGLEDILYLEKPQNAIIPNRVVNYLFLRPTNLPIQTSQLLHS